jgi:hypothetical protein
MLRAGDDFQSPVGMALGNATKGLNFALSDPTNTVSLSPNWSQTKPLEVEGSFKVTGVTENDPASKIHWVIREDKLKKAGIRHTLSVAAIVSYTPGRKLAAKLRIRADVALQAVKPLAGRKDDPIYFDSKKDTAYDTVLPQDLRPLTGLDAVGGTWSYKLAGLCPLPYGVQVQTAFRWISLR